MKNYKAKMLALLVLAGAVGLGTAAPAYAAPPHNDRGHNDGGYHDNRGRHEGWHRPAHYAHPYGYGSYGYGPSYVVAPPPVVYYGPPEPSPGINLILPLNFH